MNWDSTRIGQASSSVFSLALMITGLVAVASFTPANTVKLSPATYVRPALSTFDSNLLAEINHARSTRGLRTLTVTAGTTDIAHGWSCHQLSNRVLAHNGRLASELNTHGSRYWTSYAENVGYESSSGRAITLFRAYMNSPAHRANILDPSARFIGVWTKTGRSARYNTIDFVGQTTRAYTNTYGSTRATC